MVATSELLEPIASYFRTGCSDEGHDHLNPTQFTLLLQPLDQSTLEKHFENKIPQRLTVVGNSSSAVRAVVVRRHSLSASPELPLSG